MIKETAFPKYVFWGSSDFSLATLKKLYELGLPPVALATEKDKPFGRGQKIAKNPLKIFAEEKKLPVIECSDFDAKTIGALSKAGAQVFLVVAYGKILPKRILDIPPLGALNIHGSLLPKYRGPSPVQTQILEDEKKIGLSLMLIDEKMDHGPVLAQKNINLPVFPAKASELFSAMASEGAMLFGEILPRYATGEIKPVPQEEKSATYTHKIKKSDGLIDLNSNPYANYLKFLAFDIWPGVFFIAKTKKGPKKIKIKEAVFENGQFKIKSVVPEGGKTMPYADFLRGL